MAIFIMVGLIIFIDNGGSMGKKGGTQKKQELSLEEKIAMPGQDKKG